MNIIEQLQSQLDPNTISQLTRQIGAESDDQTEAAVSGIISTLFAGLSKNAAKPEGAAALVSAIDRDHDGSMLEDLAGFVLGNREPENPNAANGIGILKHILGNNQSRTTDMLSKTTGLKNGQIIKLMISLAPIVLAMLGKARRQDNMDVGGIGDLLRKSVEPQSNQRQDVGLIKKFLDKDGDGQVMDDIVNMGKNFFLRKR